MGITAVMDAIARELTLFAAAGLFVGGLDDLAIDLVFLLRLAWRGGARVPSVDTLASPADRRIAVVVAAWREAAVIGTMLRAALARFRHPDYLIFVATYPNDRATIDVVTAIAECDSRLRLVVNPRPGPTTKADNLNAAWRALEREEQASGRPFAALLVHDAEDVVHPDELTVAAALIGPGPGGGGGGADVVQLPVMPLVHPAAPLVSGHYLDEFAESHGKQLIVRAALGAGMPLAGTGCAIALPMLRRLAGLRGGAPFDPASLVEDYEMGLAVAAQGGRGVFARYRDRDGALVVVRAYFPGRFTAAARQKARWMTGIALAGWDRTGWSRPSALADHWWRLRDRRGPLAVVVLAAAYAALIAWAIADLAHWWRGAAMPLLAPTWLIAANAALLGWRLAMRIGFTARDHGWRQGLLAIPRFLVGNMVALAAAPRALATYLPMLAGRMPAWDKTEHEIPPLSPVAEAAA